MLMMRRRRSGKGSVFSSWDNNNNGMLESAPCRLGSELVPVWTCQSQPELGPVRGVAGHNNNMSWQLCLTLHGHHQAPGHRG